MECHTEQVLLSRKRDRAIDDLTRHTTHNGESQRDCRKPAGLLRRAFANELHTAALQVVTAFLDHVHDVHGHAPGDREGKRLNGRGTREARAIEQDGSLAGRAGKNQIAIPDQFRDGGRLGSRFRHARIVSNRGSGARRLGSIGLLPQLGSRVSGGERLGLQPGVTPPENAAGRAHAW